jgi:lipid II:glycine glycyltransferase (peptidoglycan interpeptide bridge formation enzyme)
MILLLEQPSPHNIPEYYQLLDWAYLIKKDYLNLERISIKDKNGDDVIFAQVYIYKLIYNYTQIYIPRGPIIYTQELSQAQIQEFWQNIESIATKYKAIFTLIEPTQDLYNNYNNLLDEYSQNTIIERLPHQTQILDLNLSEEDLLQNMHSKMRYNIRLAQKKGLSIHTVSKNHPYFEKYFDVFFNLIQETATRGDFAIHPKSHYRNLLQHSSDNIKVSLIIAEYEQEVLAANIILDTPEQRVYLHGASSSRNRNLMAPPLLQWEAILEAKKLGKKIYDFWGVSTTKKSWQGISRFKTQFGGRTIDYPKSRIVIHKSLIFKLYSLFRKIRGKVI